MTESTAVFRRFRETGDSDAMRQCFDLVAPKMLRLTVQLCGDIDQAEDLLHSTFLTALQNKTSSTRPVISRVGCTGSWCVTTGTLGEILCVDPIRAVFSGSPLNQLLTSRSHSWSEIESWNANSANYPIGAN